MSEENGVGVLLVCIIGIFPQILSVYFSEQNLCIYDVWLHNYRLGDDIQSNVLAFAFGLSAEIERNLISQRTKEALARKKAEGVQLGRPSGKLSAQDTYKLYPKEKQIMKLRAKGVSFVKIGKILKVNIDTVRRYYHTFMEEKTQVAHTNL